MKEKLSPYLIIGGGLFLFYFPLFSGKLLFFGDNYNLFAPVKGYFAQEVKQGRFPLWNPYLFAGSPFLADLNYGLLSPFNLPFFIFEPLRALTFSALLTVVVFGLGTYWWLGQRGEKTSVSIIVAVLAAASGSVVAALNNLSILETMACFPLVVGFLERGIGKVNPRWFLAAGLALAVSILGGHPQFVFGLALTLPLYLFLTFSQKRRLAGLGLLTATAVAVGLTAVQTLPFYQFWRLSQRPVNQPAYYSAGALPKVGLIRLALPWFFGLKNNGTSWAFLSQRNMGLASTAGYLGLLPLLLSGGVLVKAISKGKKRLVSQPQPAFWASFAPALLMLALSLGPATPVFQVCAKAVPFCGYFRNPEQYLFFWTFWLLPVVALGLKAVWSASPRPLVIALAGAGFLGLLVSTWPAVLNRLTVPLVNPYLIEKNNEAYQVIQGLVRQNLVVAAMILLGAAGSLRLNQQLKVLAWGLLLLVDLFWLGRGDLIAAPRAKVAYPEMPVAVAKLDPEVKILSEADVKPYHDLQTYWNQLAVRPPFGASRVDGNELETFTIFRSITSSLPVNLNLLYRRASPDGYGSLVLKSYARWVGGPEVINSIDPSWLIKDRPEADAKRASLNLRYLLTGGGKLEALRQDEGVSQTKRIPSMESKVLVTTKRLGFYPGLMITLASLIGAGWLWRFWG